MGLNDNVIIFRDVIIGMQQIWFTYVMFERESSPISTRHLVIESVWDIKTLRWVRDPITQHVKKIYIREVDKWKATEFRQFLHGIVVIVGQLLCGC